MGSRELRNSRTYAEWCRPFGFEHEIIVGLDAPLSHTKVFLFDRSGSRDFNERDRALLDLLRPHFANLYRAAHTRRRLRAALALLESMEAAMVLVERGDRIAFASPAAHDLLARYFGSGTRLPEQVVAWLRQDQSVHGESLAVERNGRSLLIHRTKDALREASSAWRQASAHRRRTWERAKERASGSRVQGIRATRKAAATITRSASSRPS
jgi:hypothetical protein